MQRMKSIVKKILVAIGILLLFLLAVLQNIIWVAEPQDEITPSPTSDPAFRAYLAYSEEIGPILTGFLDFQLELPSDPKKITVEHIDTCNGLLRRWQEVTPPPFVADYHEYTSKALAALCNSISAASLGEIDEANANVRLFHHYWDKAKAANRELIDRLGLAPP